MSSPLSSSEGAVELGEVGLYRISLLLLRGSSPSSFLHIVHVDTRWLELLNQVGLLLVREHEIVAVLPKRSGPRADLSIMTTTDSVTHSDVDTNSDISEDDHSNNVNPQVGSKIQDDFGYFITRIPHRNSKSTPQDLLEALGEVDTLTGILTHLSTYPMFRSLVTLPV
ncbi:hypothetical protein EV426DRAFT_706442 [Tirmania nivea]|nr:hypothetical protein EV426DRAFT_706442 [Tirmania nivea]